MEPKPLYGGLTVYRERGRYLRKLEQFEKAKDAYDEAFKYNPEDVRLLIGRSQTCSDAVKPQQAYDDARLALQLEPMNMNAHNMQARAMYTMSDFERSTVRNYKSARYRTQPPYFKEGIIQGLETIQDCIGKQTGDVLVDFLPIIHQQEVLYGDDAPVVKKHVSRIPRTQVKKKLSQMETRKHKMLSRVLAMKYLGPMAWDKFFLQDLLEDKRVPSANSSGSRELIKLVEEALKALNDRQEMLRTQRPYYSIQRAGMTRSKYLDKYKQESLENERNVGTRHAELSLRQIDKCLREKRVMDMMRLAERMQSFLDAKTPRTLPDKESFIERLYRYVGEGYLCMYRMSYKISEKSNRSRIGFLMGLPHARPTSFDSVKANFPYSYYDKKRYTERLITELDLCENAQMRCWLLYELAQINNSQKNYALAKFYAKRCQREAEDILSTTWWLNACFSLMSGDLRQGNIHEVENMIIEAFDWTAKLQYPDTLRTFLRKCMDFLSGTVPSDESKEITKRENEILKVMDEQTRTETTVLFKRMSRVPVGRRFSVLPRQSTSHVPKQTSVRRKLRQRGLSVVPGKEKPLRAPKKSTVLGFQIFDI